MASRAEEKACSKERGRERGSPAAQRREREGVWMRCGDREVVDAGQSGWWADGAGRGSVCRSGGRRC